MGRAAAKNFAHVIVIVDPSDYKWIGKRIQNGQSITLQERKKLALKAFQYTASYDTAISQYLMKGEEQLMISSPSTGLLNFVFDITL